MAALNRISPCLWFDDQAEEAARFYVGVFPNSRITQITRFGEAGHEIHRQAPGSVMVAAFELDGQPFTALNGGPAFRFTEAVSFQVWCDTQEEVDHYWERLSEGGDPLAQQCGWLKDRFGLSWQVIPRAVMEWLSGPDTARAERVMNAILQMKRLDLAAIRQAADGA